MAYGRRRYSRRASSPRAVVQSFKKVLNFAPTSRAAAAVTNSVLSNGKDSIAAGQTSTTDDDVPTGSIIKFFEITFCVTNLVLTSSFHHICIQLTHNDQTQISPNVVGGSDQRNQVFFQAMFSVGQGQNSTHIYRFKVPKRFQRVRAGDKWSFTKVGSAVNTDATQVIYKFYR